jgi:putative phosphotransacetylase
MDETALKRLIQNTVLTALARRGQYYLPAAVSARHVHLSRRDFRTLFGEGAAMTRCRDLSQPGQFACGETVELCGPKGSFGRVRVLGPERAATQVEISVSDSFVLGIKPVIRMSGDTAGSPGCVLKGPAGSVELSEGVIVAARHVHMSEEQGAAYGVKDGDIVSVITPAPRRAVLGDIVVRCGKGYELEVHLDTDEANGNGILCGTIFPAVINRGVAGRDGDWPCPAEGGAEDRNAGLERGGNSQRAKRVSSGLPPLNQERFPVHNALDLITERDVNGALARGETALYCAVRGFVSPAAADRAKEKGITICRLQG